MNQSRIRSLSLATLALLFGLHSLRVFVPTMIWYLGQYLEAEGLALYALATFALTLLAPWGRGRLGERGALALAVGGLALARLGIQWVRAPGADLALSTVAIGLWGWFMPLWSQSRRNCPRPGDVPLLASAFSLAFLLDTGSRTLLLSYDLAWRRGVGANLVVSGLVGLTLALLWQELRADSGPGSAEEPTLRRVLPLVGLGPWLYLAMAVTHNPAALATSTGWQDAPAHLMVNGTVALGALLCVLVAGRARRQRWPWALTAGGLLTFFVAGIGPGWLSTGLAALGAWLALGGILTGTARVGPLRPGLWRSSVATFAALATLLAIVIMVNEYDLLWATPLSAGGLALAALWAARVDAGWDGKGWRVGEMLVAGTAVGALLVVGAWAWLSRPPQALQDPPAGRPARLMTYNIHQGMDAEARMDLEGIATVIAAQRPDVVALNEVNRARATNGFVDTLPLISRRLGMPYVLGANYADGQYGNALLSRYPILAWDNTHYQHNSTEVRGLLRVTVKAPGGPLTLFVTHLDHLGSPGHVRDVQVSEALAIWSGAPRAVLLGDLNAGPDAPELQSIYEAGFVDVLAATGQGDVFTFWGPFPRRRIDYIFVTADLSLEGAWVVQSRASDHLPVLAELE